MDANIKAEEQPHDNQVQSIENQLSDSPDEMLEEVNENAAIFQIEMLNELTANLHEDQEILKETLKIRQQQVLKLYYHLSEKKKYLLTLIQRQYNNNRLSLDIGLSQEFQELNRVIQSQSKEIQQLRFEVNRLGLSGGNNHEDFIKIKTKSDDMEKEIKVGRKFSSTQYVRDYLERPQAYKVSYEDVKYEYEQRLKIKESLEQEKSAYLKKKEEINAAKKKERELEQQLLKERDSLLK